ncbi:MAG: toll/interleukin-1 receptor domain-containing protein, partial [Actinobacteria bacterium]|nr:toll/interleukin-1 receptor domain-containing protein [Actinomycetota bacterium]
MSGDQTIETRPLRVFLSYASEDAQRARRLAMYLRGAGVEVWLDEDNLLPGQDWHSEITAAVRNSDAIIVCVSSAATTKEGYVQREIRMALDIAEEKPDGTIFIIPTLLDETAVPARLRKWQWVDLSGDSGVEKGKLLRALVRRAEGLGSVSLPQVLTIRHDTGAPDLKYYYYISRTKIEMLGAQLGTPMAGSSISEAVDAVSGLTKSLVSRSLVTKLGPGVKLEPGRLYLSTAEWRHGLFYVRAGSPDSSMLTSVMYLIWQRHEDSIVLLTGSPQHILGNKVVQGGMNVGSDSMIGQVYGIATALSIGDKPIFLAEGHRARSFAKSEASAVEDPDGFDFSTAFKGVNRRNPADGRALSVRLGRPGTGHARGSDALQLAVFCFVELGGLISTPLEVLFQCFSRAPAQGGSIE